MNETVRDYDSGKWDLQQRQERYTLADKADDAQRLIVWAGTGVGDVNEIMPAGEVVRQMEREAVEALTAVGGYLQV